MHGHVRATRLEQIRQVLDLLDRHEGIGPARTDEDIRLAQVRRRLGLKRQHRAQQRGSPQRIGVTQEDAGRDVGAVRKSDRHHAGAIEPVLSRRRLDELVQFVEAASAEYGFDRASVVAVGFSNGANIAASILLRYPNALRGAALLSPMLPFEPESTPDLGETDVFIGAGRADPLVPVEQVKHLADLLKSGGANVTVHWDQGGHTISPSELKAAQKWAAGIV